MFIIQYEPLLVNSVEVGEIGTIPWDLESFGFGVADLRMNVQYDHQLLEPSLIRVAVKNWARQAGIELVGINLPSEQTHLISLWQDVGFRYIDTFISLRYDKVDRAEYQEHFQTELLEAKHDDEEELRTLVLGLFTIGRYHSDPSFPPILADRRYQDWISRALKPESNQKVMIAKNEGTISGFSVIQIDGETGYYHLLATAKKWHGTPLALKINASTLRHFKAAGVKSVGSKISAVHTKVLNLHAFFGARFSSPHVLLHWQAPWAQFYTKSGIRS